MSPPPIRQGPPPTTAAAGVAGNQDGKALPIQGSQNVSETPETQDSSGGAIGGPVQQPSGRELLLASIQNYAYQRNLANLEKAFTNASQLENVMEAKERLYLLDIFEGLIPQWLQTMIDAAVVCFEQKFAAVSSMANYKAYSKRWEDLKFHTLEEIHDEMLDKIQGAADLENMEARSFLYFFLQGGHKSLSEEECQKAWGTIHKIEAEFNPGPEMCYEYCVHTNNKLSESGKDYFSKFNLSDLHKMYNGIHAETQ